MIKTICNLVTSIFQKIFKFSTQNLSLALLIKVLLIKRKACSETPIGRFKPSQHVGQHCANIVGTTCWEGLFTLLANVGRCWRMLVHVGTCWPVCTTFLNWIKNVGQHSPTFLLFHY